MISVVAVLSALVLCAQAVPSVPIKIQWAGSEVLVCVTATSLADGSDVIIVPCTDESRAWTVSGGVGTGVESEITLDERACLDVRDGVDENGTHLQVWTCFAGNTNQFFSWDADGTIHWVAGTNKCLDLNNGNLTTGNFVQVWDCTEGPNQKWSSSPVAKINEEFVWDDPHSIGLDFCIASNSTTNGSPVILDFCNSTTSSVVWSLAPSVANGTTNGTISTPTTNKCLDVTGGVNADGTKLQIWDCVEGDTNQIWHVPEDSTFFVEWAGTNKCVDVGNGTAVPGTQLQLADCGFSGPEANNIRFFQGSPP